MSKEITTNELLTAALVHIPFDGWTNRSFYQACDDLSVDHGWFLFLFPEGIPQAVDYFLLSLDDAMAAEIVQLPLAQMKVRDKISTAILSVLRHATPHKEALYKASRFLAQPQHAALAAKCLYRTVDRIWFAVGDTSTDFNFYTKRATLAAVFSSTSCAWFSDESEDIANTKSFLARRIENVMQIEKAKALIKSWLPKQWRSA